MPYRMFHDRFPELAERETRNLYVIDDPLLPADAYALVELYCDEPGCDCRRVMLDIFAESRRESVAVVAWGWETREYYRKWAQHGDEETIRELQGPILNRLSPQSELAPALLARVWELVLQDPGYVARLKRHYRMFRDSVEAEAHRDLGGTRTREPGRKVGGNEPCPCGSGRKYKHCCLNAPG